MRSRLLTLAEVCARYGVSDRWARDLVREHKVPVLRLGRRWMFDGHAERAFLEASRECLLSNSADVRVPRTGGSKARSTDNEFAKALALTTSALPENASPSEKPNSTVLPFTAHRSAAGSRSQPR